jgi:hypothetical protein
MNRAGHRRRAQQRVRIFMRRVGRKVGFQLRGQRIPFHYEVQR